MAQRDPRRPGRPLPSVRNAVPYGLNRSRYRGKPSFPKNRSYQFVQRRRFRREESAACCRDGLFAVGCGLSRIRFGESRTTVVGLTSESVSGRSSSTGSAHPLHTSNAPRVLPTSYSRPTSNRSTCSLSKPEGDGSCMTLIRISWDLSTRGGGAIVIPAIAQVFGMELNTGNGRARTEQSDEVCTAAELLILHNRVVL
jgi:hypothetical protein